MENVMPVLDKLGTIPLYKDYPDDVRLDDAATLSLLPLLQKNQITKPFPALWLTEKVRQAIQDDGVEYATTSGTSGDKLQIIREKDWWRSEYLRAYKYHPALEAFDPDTDHKAVLTTAVCSSAVCWRTNPSFEERIVGSTLFLNTESDPNYWSREKVADIIAEFDHWKPVFLEVHAGYAAILARKALQFNLPRPKHKPKLIAIGYDFTPLAIKRTIEDFFGSRVYEFYGSTEFGYAYLETPNGFAAVADHSKMEFFPVDGRLDLRRLVITTFKNAMMPLVRYDSGDVFKVDPETGDTPVKTYGRLKDFIHDDDGTLVGPRDLDDAIERSKSSIVDYQLLHSHDELCLAVVGTADNDSIVHSLKQLFGAKRNVTIKTAAEIAPEESGKFRRIKPL